MPMPPRRQPSRSQRRSVVRPLVLGAMSHKMAFLQQTDIFVEKTPEPSSLPDRLKLFSDLYFCTAAISREAYFTLLAQV